MTQLHLADFQANGVLAALPPPSLERLAPHLQRCLFHFGQHLYDAHDGHKARYAYFPKAGLISLVLTTRDGTTVEANLIGRGGAVGIGEILSGAEPLLIARVQADGSGWRIPAEAFRQEYQRDIALQGVMLRHRQAYENQIAQLVLCNRLHPIKERLSMWLLTADDRSHSDTFEVTHELLATMLGSQRAGVTIAAGELRGVGLINYTRGCVTILDRAGLEEQACECYSIIRHQSEYWCAPSDE